jgi:Rrf2 family protein
MFSQTVEYALRAVVYLAGHEGAQTTLQIAAVTKVPAAYLAKVLQNLSRAEIVRSQRGLHGGFSLSRPSTDLTIWEIVQAVEPIRRIRECPLDLDAHGTVLCPLHKKMDDALAHIEHALVSSTIADILSEPTPSKPLCPFPHSPAVSNDERIPLKT